MTYFTSVTSLKTLSPNALGVTPMNFGAGGGQLKRTHQVHNNHPEIKRKKLMISKRSQNV